MTIHRALYGIGLAIVLLPFVILLLIELDQPDELVPQGWMVARGCTIYVLFPVCIPLGLFLATSSRRAIERSGVTPEEADEPPETTCVSCGHVMSEEHSQCPSCGWTYQ